MADTKIDSLCYSCKHRFLSAKGISADIERVNLCLKTQLPLGTAWQRLCNQYEEGVEAVSIMLANGKIEKPIK